MEQEQGRVATVLVPEKEEHVRGLPTRVRIAKRTDRDGERVGLGMFVALDGELGPDGGEESRHAP